MNNSGTIIVDTDNQTCSEDIDTPFIDAAVGEAVEYIEEVVYVEADDDSAGANGDACVGDAIAVDTEAGDSRHDDAVDEQPSLTAQTVLTTADRLHGVGTGAADMDAEADHGEACDETDNGGGPNSETQHSAAEDDDIDTDGLPVIRVTGGKLPQILAQAQAILRATGAFYSSGNQIVNVVKDRATGEAMVAPLSKARLSVVLSGAAAWLVKSGRNGGLRRVDAPDGYCAKLMQLEQLDGLQPLAGLARQPFMRQDGSMCSDAGYDASTGLYGAFKSADFPLVASPTMADAEAALARLDGLLTEFPFATDHDRSAALAAMLTAAVRPSLAVAPMFLVTAPEAGTGKTFLCHLIAALATGRAVAPQTFPRHEEEVDKVLLAELRANPPVVLFDNLAEDIKAFQKLCVVLTSERVSGRILGSSVIANVSTRSLLLASGNNVKPSRDMQRRCITISLDSKTELPASRMFRQPDLLESALHHRGELVAAALTVVKAWISAGRPTTNCRPLASYEAWSAWCRQPLLWLGRSDPAESAFAAMHEDPERQLLESLLVEWHAAFGSSSVMVRNLVDRAVTNEDGVLKDVLTDISDSSDSMNSRRIGRWIARHAGRVVGGLRIESQRRTRNAEAWKVVSV